MKSLNINTLNKAYSNMDKKYWENRLSGELQKVNFANGFISTDNSQYIKEEFEFKISGDVWAGIKKLCGGSDFKLHMVITACINILLYKYSGCEDIIIGSPIYRQKVEANFINTILAIRNSFNSSLTFKELLLKTREAILEANEHQNYPIETLLERLDISSDGYGFPLFDVMLILSSIHDRNYVRDVETNITFIFSKEQDELIGTIEFNSLLYKKHEIKRIASHFDQILSVIRKNVNILIKDINILSEEETQKILYEFNSAEQLDIENKLLHGIFEQQVIKTPDKVAIISGEEEITYEELNKKANKLARFLREKQVRPNDIVGIMAEPSIDMIVGIMAVLKAGAAYLPLDPGYPQDRLKFFIEDSKVKVVITQRCFMEILEYDLDIIDITRIEELDLSDTNLETVNMESDLAYVIYTSGSTGTPKGVLIEHHAVSETIAWRGTEYNLDIDDTVLQLFSFAFDGFVTSFFTPITRGSRIILLGTDEIKNPNAIKKCIKEKKVTHFINVPTLFVSIMEALTPEEAKNLRVITLAGDKVTVSAIRKAKEKNIDMELVNEYGPTENCIVSTIFRNINEDTYKNIGKPVVNTKVYILDKDDNICPIGVIGEICLAGGRVARGYLNRKELTLQKFVNNSFENVGTMYRTGDLAKWTEDGNIEFIGRKDYQVKIRGFRIELGEIEARIQEHKSISEVVVIDKEYENGNKYVCAYFVAEKDITLLELREYLSSRLPEYMIPSYFIPVESIPLTPAGKVNRKALPVPNNEIDTGVKYVEPRNQKEAQVASVWKEVLGIKDVGIDDNFFHLGGDSLKAIEITGKLSQNYKISPNDMFKYQNIRELAEKIIYNKENIAEKLDKMKEAIVANGLPSSSEEYELKLSKKEQELYDSYIQKNKKYDVINLELEIDYKNILLTGATGFVGIYILRELMISTSSIVYLLVRAKKIEDARYRIIEKINFYFGEEFYEKYKDRIKVIKGDITEINFGLQKGEYIRLAEEIDCIINSAAFVKHYGKYETFYNVNVKGVERLLSFAFNRKKKDFNQISTMSVAGGKIRDEKRVIFTEDDVDLGQVHENYYQQTKLDAERLVLRAAENSLNVKIFRLGNVVFDSHNGKFQENITDNAFYVLLRSFIKINCFPNLKRKAFDFSYVDQIAKSFVLLFNKKQLQNEIFHIYNHKKVSTAGVAEMMKKSFSNISITPLEEFISYISDNLSNNSISSYCENILLHSGILDSSDITEFTNFSNKTSKLLSRLDFSWSSLNHDMMCKNIDYCERINFL